jgi:hypothetical protein
MFLAPVQMDRSRQTDIKNDVELKGCLLSALGGGFDQASCIAITKAKHCQH